MGNDTFRAIVECYKKDYRDAKQRWEKTVINKNITQHVLNEGMVFVAKKGNMWFPVPEKRIYRKVAQALREKTPALKALPAMIPPSSLMDTRLDGFEQQPRRASSASIVSLESSVASGGDEAAGEGTDALEWEPLDRLLDFDDMDDPLSFEPLFPDLE